MIPPYLTEPKIVSIGSTESDVYYSGLIKEYLEEIGGTDYLYDDEVDPSDELIMFAGQLCYQAFGENRTKNKDSKKYMMNIIQQRHFSVFEHVSVTYLFYGVSRSLTHELVRHRHLSFSQVSQRYVNKVRFVERPEFQDDGPLHNEFTKRIEKTMEDYQSLIDYLSGTEPYISIENRTERRKAVQQVARAILPNETEAPIVVSGNLRAWRHFINLRGSPYAETEIQRLTKLVFENLRTFYPHQFQDYSDDMITEYTEQ